MLSDQLEVQDLDDLHDLHVKVQIERDQVEGSFLSQVLHEMDQVEDFHKDLDERGQVEGFHKDLDERG